MKDTTLDDFLEFYSFDFEKVLNHQEIFELYKQYLTKTRNLENLLFFEEVQAYKSLENASDRYKVAKAIKFNFFNESSPNQLNIPSHLKTIVSKSQISKMECASTLFDRVEQLIIVQMKEGTFTDFLKWEVFQEYVKKEFEKSKHNSLPKGLMSVCYNRLSRAKVQEEAPPCEQRSENTNLRDRSMSLTSIYNNRGITNNDFDNLRRVSDDYNLWQVLDDRSGCYTSYYSTEAFSTRNKGLRSIKISVTLPYHYKSVFAVLFPLKNRFHPSYQIVESKHVGYVQNKEVKSSIFYERYKLGLVFWDRDVYVHTSVRHSPDERKFYVVTRDFEEKETDGVIRCHHRGGWIIERIDKQATRLIRICHYDFQISKGIYHLSLANQAKKLFAQVSKLMEENVDQNTIILPKDLRTTTLLKFISN